MARQAVLEALGQSAFHSRKLLAANNGTAAIEFALMLGSFTIVMLNGVEISRYYYGRMELENASQTAGQAAWAACDSSKLPATTYCPGLSTAITQALASTSLGAQVTQQSGSPSEGYYCVSTAGDLTYVSSVNSKPADCSSVGNASDLPGDYIKIQAQYAYRPIFSGITVGTLLPTTVNVTTWMRLK